MASSPGGMRIITLPLTTRATGSSRTSNNLLPLTYYHFQSPRPTTNTKGKESIVRRAANKASDTWAGFGKAPEGNWKRRVFSYGERLIDRIDFEELSLKGIDPSLGPQIGQFRRGDSIKGKTLLKIPLFYPPSTDLGHNTSSPLPHMQLVLEKRTPHHRKGFYTWLVIAPLTAPFALIPVVPNLPFFYAAWRAWSHYRAWKASEYMQDLINSNHIVPEPSFELDEVYTSHIQSQLPTEKSSSISRKSSPDPPDYFSPSSPPRILLGSDSVSKIVAIFNLSGSAGTDILRAIEQAKVRIDRINKHE